MSKANSFTSDEKTQAYAYIIHPEVKSKESENTRDLAFLLDEVCGLARAIHLDIAEVKVVNVARIQAGHFLGKGNQEDIGAAIEALEPEIVIFNHTLSPVQQRNLEKEWNAKVIDRTGLILEIFGERAQTKEGRLQVELAALEYQRSRLVRSWTHLERQRGATGFIGGPGETQIEIDRRLIGERIARLKKELENVRRTRDLGRQSRVRIPLPVVALVGYTNAGKSTLFNTLTGADVFAEDLPFATLDPTLRKMKLPVGQDVILSDTVGFIADLPTHLVAAFRATLEHTIHGDALVHVIDVSRPDWQAQRQDVIGILHDLGIEYETDERVIEVYNKIDVLDEEALAEFQRLSKSDENVTLLSALQGIGLDDLLESVSGVITRQRGVARFSLPAVDGKALAWLYAHAEVLNRKDEGVDIDIEVSIEPEDLNKFVSRFKYNPVD